jgi:translation elongation factor EF-G
MQATQFAFADCYEDGTWLILEPIMNVEVTGPEEFQGQVNRSCVLKFYWVLL